MAKKIGIISDTHDLLRPEVMEILKNCDCILHAGDICRPEILDAIRPLASLYVVQGNNDRNLDVPLRKTLEFTIEGVHFFMAHEKRDVAWNLGKAQVVICGHTHHYSEQWVGDRLWLNPGSCGVSRFGGEVTMAVMEVQNGKFQVEKILFEKKNKKRTIVLKF